MNGEADGDRGGRAIDGTGDGEVVVAGDVHLGADNANVAAFNSFLDDVADRDPAHLVLLGDVWDLVRRDPFGAAWETSETITRLKALAAQLPVSVVFGNHDGHLRHLDAALYDVRFREALTLESGDSRIRFHHGEEFDRLHSDALSAYLSGPGDRGDIDPTRGRKDPIVAWGRGAIQRGKRRLRTVYATDGGEEGAARSFPRRERRAHAHLDGIPEDKLIFGHTHAPYVHPENVAANPGSWKTTAPVHDTYLVVDGGDISLFRHRTEGADERLEPADVGAA